MGIRKHISPRYWHSAGPSDSSLSLCDPNNDCLYLPSPAGPGTQSHLPSSQTTQFKTFYDISLHCEVHLTSNCYRQKSFPVDKNLFIN